MGASARLRPSRRPAVRLGAVGAALAAALLLAGCADGADPGPTGTAAGAPTETAGAAAPEYVPGGTAEENKEYFDHVLEPVVAANPAAAPRDLVDALVDAGFDKSAMQVTAAETAIGLEPDMVIVAVMIAGDECLLGQRGTRGYSSSIQPVFSTGECLIGKPDPIDW
ncbi:MAG: hypothetical protein GXX90_05205 [Microbacteriaceae bacterium]|nr:hypothetical protein [Microbacteriaceae bacterium]